MVVDKRIQTATKSEGQLFNQRVQSHLLRNFKSKLLKAVYCQKLCRERTSKGEELNIDVLKATHLRKIVEIK